MTLPTVKLGTVAEFIRGITFKPDDIVPTGTNDAVVCMRTKNVQANLDCSDVLTIPAEFVRRDNQFLGKGDILVSSANSWNLVGKCSWIPELPWKATFGGFVSVLRGERQKVDPRYLYWWFSSDRIQALLRSFGQKTTNISNLNMERCLQLDFPLPPRSEQRRIAAILDTVHALRAQRQETLALLDSLALSIFVENFAGVLQTAERIPLGTFVDEFRYGTSNKSGVTGFPALRIPNVVGGSLNLTELKTVSVNAAEFSRLKLIDGDLLFVRTNGNRDYVGRSAVFYQSKVENSGFDVDSYIYASYLIRARLKTKQILPTVLQFFLSTEEGKRELRSYSKTSAGQFNINTEGLGAIRIPNFPMQLQETFVEKLGVIEKKRASQRAFGANLDALFTSLQHRAFRGEL